MAARTAGIVGGIGPESTIEYYRTLIAAYKTRVADGHAPSVLINSVDVQALLAMMSAGRSSDVADYLVAALERLAKAGADLGLIAANTPHVVFDEVRQRVSLP